MFLTKVVAAGRINILLGIFSSRKYFYEIMIKKYEK